MAKLPPIRVNKWNGAIKFSHEFPLSVLTDGTFQAEIEPDMQSPMVQLLAAEKEKAERVTRSPDLPHIGTNRAGTPIISAARKDVVESFLNRFATWKTEGVETRETFIAYSTEFRACYVVDTRDGDVYSTGYQMPGGSDDFKEHGKWRGNSSATDAHATYSMGIGARVWVRIVTTSPDGQSSVKWAQAKGEEGSPIALLHQFTHMWSDPAVAAGERNVSMGHTPFGDRSTKRIMPYSDEACLFFYNTMMEICRMNERMQNFFGDRPEVLLENLSSGVKMLGGPSE